jgi:hypothetical protein
VDRVRSDKRKFVQDMSKMHDRIGISPRPETAPRSKSLSRKPFDSGDPQNNFEARVDHIVSMKAAQLTLNSSVLETWINETLKDAEHLEIPGLLLKPMHKQPMVRYSVDRLFLHSQGLEVKDIERIYRSLFVYSIGFYEMILKCVAHAKNKYSILASLWKVFQILLEYCCKSNYQMLVAKITQEHQ